MNRGPFIFIGVLAIISLSWALTLVKPISEAGHLVPVDLNGVRVPAAVPGLAAQGSALYAELGCVNCHTQQVRVTSGYDIQRGWGERQSMPIDYIEQSPVLTGTERVGPDLTNVGARRPDLTWHLLHFYNPQIVTKGSNMPPFRFLYEVREIVGEESTRALDIPADFAPEPGYEVLPSREAEALAAYMLSLNIQSDLPEAPTPERIGLSK